MHKVYRSPLHLELLARTNSWRLTLHLDEPLNTKERDVPMQTVRPGVLRATRGNRLVALAIVPMQAYLRFCQYLPRS